MSGREMCMAIFAVSLAACGSSTDSGDLGPGNPDVAAAEAFVDAFYSFDSNALLVELSTATESVPTILFYQGWAEGGNYEVIDRMPCEAVSEADVNCSITVKDDLIGALGVGVNVTDTFHLAFFNGQLVSVTNSSNDPEIYYQAQEWVEENYPELIEMPCTGFFDGGPTPGDCVRAMVQGYSKFAASSEFPENNQAIE